jgi:hypothetical protein
MKKHVFLDFLRPRRTETRGSCMIERWPVPKKEKRKKKETERGNERGQEIWRYRTGRVDYRISQGLWVVGWLDTFMDPLWSLICQPSQEKSPEFGPPLPHSMTFNSPSIIFHEMKCC